MNTLNSAARASTCSRCFYKAADELGESFIRGIVFHTGRQPFELDSRIWALPIATLWA